MTDLSTFLHDTAVILIGELPLQSLDSAINYVNQYLSDIGGWVPDDPIHPNGPGHPFNNFTEQQAADAITTNEFNKVYDVEFTVTASVRVQFAEKLTAGLTLGAAAASMQNHVSDFITNAINNSFVPVNVLSTSTQTTVVGGSLTSGFTTQSVRQLIATEISSPTKDVDYKALALSYVRNTYGVDNTWNVSSLYTETNQPIAISIRKYTNTTYSTLDGGDTTIYLISVSPTTYQIVSGVIVT